MADDDGNKENSDSGQQQSDCLKCDECSMKFTQKSNLRRHAKEKHGIGKTDGEAGHDEDVACHHCKKVFASERSRDRHILLMHKPADVVASDTKSTSERHVPGSRISCRDCDAPFETIALLRQHLSDGHEVEEASVKEEMSFESLQEFNEWKQTMEREMKASYVACKGASKKRNGYSQTFYCNRSGYARLVADDKRQRAPQAQGSRKLDNACTSAIQISVELSGTVSVAFYKHHHGHGKGLADLVHVPLPRADREWIAGKLMQGVTLEHVLDEIRDNSAADRRSLVERKDLRNIMHSFGLDKVEQLHSDDATSVDLWVKENEADVPFYKAGGVDDAQGLLAKKDFVLVIMSKSQTDFFMQHMTDNGEQLKMCMDSTHGIGRHGFQLTTLMTVTDLHEGFPVAYCISSRVDEVTMTCFLEAVRRGVGEVRAHVFMTDDAPVYANAWRKVMGDVAHQLLCAWHVDRAFRQNLSKVQGSENKAMMYSVLRTIMDERDKATFHRLLEGLRRSMELNEDLRDFGEYFQRYYVPRVHLWASSYREGLGLNTNMHLESLHKVLKHIYMQGKRVQRVDRVICAVVKMTRDKVFSRMIGLARGRTVSQSRRGFFQRHRRGAELAQDVVQMEHGVYLVPASDDDDHVVKRGVPCTSQCRERCGMCGVCPHTYVCECEDSRRNICKHAHAVAIFRSDPIEAGVRATVEQELETHMSNVSETAGLDSADVPDPLETAKRRLGELLSELTAEAATCQSLSAVKAATAGLQKVKALFDADKRSEKLAPPPTPSTSREPANKNVEKQVRFFSRKRPKPTTPKDFSRPSKQARRILSDVLLEDSDEEMPVIISQNCNTEHRY